jgi:hypothetical protein
VNRKIAKKSGYPKIRLDIQPVCISSNKLSVKTCKRVISPKIRKQVQGCVKSQKLESKRSASFYARIIEHDDIGIDKAIILLKSYTTH